MKGFRSAARLGAALILVAFVYTFAFGTQQSSTPKKKSPSLTTDDVIRPKADTSSESSDSSGGAKADATGAKAEGDKPSPEEAAWREQVAAAREKAARTQRAAEEAELRVTDIRNELSRPGHTANERNNIAAELDAVGRQVLDLRAQARAAADEFNKVLEEGREKGFTEAPGLKAQSDDGKPNDQYYRERYAKLTQNLRDAERKVQLYENRLRELNQQITNQSVSGDNFYIARLQQDRDEAQRQMTEAQAAYDKARADIDDLMEEARRAGVPPGVFR